VLGFGGPPALAALGLKGRLAAGASGPLEVLAASLPFFAISSAAASWLEGLGRMTPPMVLMWVANGLNLALDLVLVPGGLGLAPMGASGAALATFSSRTFLAVATVGYAFGMKDARRFGVWDKPAPSRALAAEQRRIGYGAGVSSLAEMASFSSMNIVAGWIGALTVAGWSVTLNVAAIIFMVPLGLSTATGVMVGKAYGARNAPALRRAALLGFAVTAVFGVAIGFLVWPLAPRIAPLYTADPTAVALATGALALACLFFLPDAMQVVVAQALRARGDVVAPSCTHLASYVLVMMPLAYWLAIPQGWGLDGIMVAAIVASYLSAALLLGRFWLVDRRA